MVTFRQPLGPITLFARLLKRTDRSARGLELSYELFETAAGHLIQVTLGEETALLLDKSGSSHAHRVYDLLVWGDVTPCTAADVFEDMMQEIDENEDACQS